MQHSLAHANFETVIGRCSIVWSDVGIVCVQLPEAEHRFADARLARRYPASVLASPLPVVQSAIDGIVSLLRGARTDLRNVTLDMRYVPDFDRRVYEVTRHVTAGSTASYGEIAAQVESRDAARAVGQALGRNPIPIIVPCHRVVASGGKIGGFSAYGGNVTKSRLLAIEGADAAGAEPSLFD